LGVRVSRAFGRRARDDAVQEDVEEAFCVRGLSGAGHGGGERHQLHQAEIGPDGSGALRRG
jgi:hypothetical protein